MAKNSLKNDEYRLENALLRELTWFNGQHNRGEQSQIRIARGNTLNRLSQILGKVADLERPDLILRTERFCEQFYLEHFAKTPKEIESSQKALQSMSSVLRALEAPLMPEEYKREMKENLGTVNMGRLTKAPQDIVHTFMRSQRQRLNQAAGQMATPPEKFYFQTRRDALQVALKIHERNCEKALGLSKEKEIECER